MRLTKNCCKIIYIIGLDNFAEYLQTVAEDGETIVTWN